MQMPRAVAPPAAALGLTLLAACSPGGTAVDVPDGSIPVTVNSEGIAAVMVGIGDDEPVPVQLDTGSTGLRIFAEATSLRAPADAPTTELRFGDGTDLTGPVVTTAVTIGERATTAPIAIQLVTDARCDTGNDGTGCPGSTDAIRREQGIWGVLGIGLEPDDAYLVNPLPALGPGFTAYRIDYDEAGGGITPEAAASGTPAGQAPSTKYPLATVAVQGLEPPAGTSFWSDRVPACWALGDSDPQCLATIFDTGTTAMVVPGSLPGAPAAVTGELEPGQGVLHYFADANANDPLWMVTSARGPATAILLQDQSPEVVAGTPFWFEHSVSYDLAAGTLTIGNR